MRSLPDEHDQTLLSLEQGEVLSDRYRLMRELGRGGMGVVWLAEDEHLDNRPVAIKVLPSALCRNARAVARLKKEALTNLELTHPHIVRLFNFEQDPQRSAVAYLVMQYVKGKTLDDLLAEHPDGLPLERVQKWADQLAQAIDHAHAKQILHRDIKPSNIIIDGDDNAYLMDFGIAREAKDTMTRVTGRDSSGTLPYMSPQQVDGQNSKSNDIYSFAASLYEAIKGEPPFSTGDLYQQIKYRQPDPIDHVPHEINVALLCAMSKNSDERPQWLTLQGAIEFDEECRGHGQLRWRYKAALLTIFLFVGLTLTTWMFNWHQIGYGYICLNTADELRPDKRGVITWSFAENLSQKAAHAFLSAGDGRMHGRSLHLQAWCMQLDNNRDGDWSRAIELYAQAARVRGDSGDKSGQGLSLHQKAWCLQPNINPDGIWSRAAGLYGQAARIRGEAGDHLGQGLSLHNKAWCLQPDHNPEGDWSRAVELYGQAARIRGEEGDHRGQGLSLHQQAWSLQPDNNPEGDWSRAFELYGQAARIRGEVGDHRGQGLSLHNQAWCLHPNHNPDGDWSLAAELFEQAARRYKEVGDKRGFGSSLHNQAWCTQPDNNPDGDWSRAAGLYEQAARIYSEVGDKRSQGLSLHQQAVCLIRAKKENMTPAARRLFERAAQLLTDAGDLDGSERSQLWIQ